MTAPQLALYLHFPWCVRKCPYCDFNSHPLNDPLDEGAYLAALFEDLEDQLGSQPEVEITSIFFGGGTPSLFSPDTFARILERLTGYLTQDAEITLEANPGTTEHHDLGSYRAAGINRVSFGAQSFDDAQLKTLGRIHQAAETFRSVDAARKGGFGNINLDLMYGLPGQSPREAAADLQTALSLDPEHLSWYQLTLEPRTEFARRPPMLPVDIMMEEIERRGYALLADAGFARYEVSAYARPGRECRHNLNYWSFGNYLGAGAGAHGKLTAPPTGDSRARFIRTVKPRQPRLYLAAPRNITRASIEVADLPGEFMLNALRLVEGVSHDTFQQRTGLSLGALEPARTQQIERGLLRADRLAATPRGYAMLDGLVTAFL
ncbi:MAG: radical SAM family heme chaperone HemW [Pseudomonadales bacterium]|nr:radical SAM family heme chaperone HemW [Pseudomonadales bacterium]